jgi:hypothetical protein
MLRNGERINPGFWARDFDTKQGTKTGVMRSRGVGLGPYGEVMRIFDFIQLGMGP